MHPERMIPERADDETFWEHLYRYKFAKKFVTNRQVLDIASGEGYGSAALLNAGAASVSAVDISLEACTHASKKYRLHVAVGNAETIPLRDHAVDVIVSFETLEHLNHPADFVAECSRVLAPHGLLIISTPNKEVFGPNGSENPFHVREFSEPEFVALLKKHFKNLKLYTQFPLAAAWWSPRSLAALTTPWVDVRGFWRLRSLFQKHTSLQLQKHLNREDPLSTAQTILAHDHFGDFLTNPYYVRKRSWIGRDQSRYLIAVAQK